MTVTVDGARVVVPRWARWRDAVTAAGGSLSGGSAWIADPRGEPVDPDGAVVDGAAIHVHHEPEEREE